MSVQLLRIICLNFISWIVKEFVLIRNYTQFKFLKMSVHGHLETTKILNKSCNFLRPVRSKK